MRYPFGLFPALFLSVAVLQGCAQYSHRRDAPGRWPACDIWRDRDCRDTRDRAGSRRRDRDHSRVYHRLEWEHDQRDRRYGRVGSRYRRQHDELHARLRRAHDNWHRQNDLSYQDRRWEQQHDRLHDRLRRDHDNWHRRHRSR